jgi:hypothetical protein
LVVVVVVATCTVELLHSPIFRHAMTIVDRALGTVDSTGLQGLLAGDVALRADHVFDLHKATHYPELYGSKAQQPCPPPFVAKSTADGTCADRSMVLGLTGQEQEAYIALRFRTALFMARNQKPLAQHAHYSIVGVHTPLVPASDIKKAFTPNAWQGLMYLASAASMLGCPITTYCPGIAQESPTKTALFHSFHIEPLGNPAGSYADKVPLTLFFTNCGAAQDPRPAQFIANHFSPGFHWHAGHPRTLAWGLQVPNFFRCPTAAQINQEDLAPSLSTAELQAAEQFADAVIAICQAPEPAPVNHPAAKRPHHRSSTLPCPPNIASCAAQKAASPARGKRARTHTGKAPGPSTAPSRPSPSTRPLPHSHSPAELLSSARIAPSPGRRRTLRATRQPQRQQAETPPKSRWTKKKKQKAAHDNVSTTPRRPTPHHEGVMSPSAPQAAGPKPAPAPAPAQHPPLTAMQKVGYKRKKLVQPSLREWLGKRPRAGPSPTKQQSKTSPTRPTRQAGPQMHSKAGCPAGPRPSTTAGPRRTCKRNPPSSAHLTQKPQASLPPRCPNPSSRAGTPAAAS